MALIDTGWFRRLFPWAADPNNICRESLTVTDRGFRYRRDTWPRRELNVDISTIVELTGFLSGSFDNVCCEVKYERDGELHALVIHEEMPGWSSLMTLFERLPGFRSEVLTGIWHPTKPSPVTLFRRSDQALELDASPFR